MQEPTQPISQRVSTMQNGRFFQRWQDTRRPRGHTEERIAIAEAVEELRLVMIHRLKWPDFRTNFLTPR